jgi:hypothetical protein
VLEIVRELIVEVAIFRTIAAGGDCVVGGFFFLM